jgi:hypothetical protein
MLRNIAAIVVGYLTAAVFVAVALSLVWMRTGAAWAYEPGTTRVTTNWLMIHIPIILVGTFLGGFLAAAIAKRRDVVRVLATIFFVLDMVLAILHATMTRPVPLKSPSQFTIAEAANYAIQPIWYDFAIPFAAAAGVLLGGSVRLRKPTA